MRILYLLLALLLCALLKLPFSVGAQPREEFKRKIFIRNNDTLNYRILYSEIFDKIKNYPFFLFLRGGGEHGSNNEAELAHNADLFIEEEIVKKFPAMVIFHEALKDGTVPPAFSMDMEGITNTIGGNAKLSLYANNKYNSWDSALAEPYLYPGYFQ